MLIRNKIEFKKGSILTSQMLTALYEQQRNILDIQYNNYSDGIINGLDFYVDNDMLFVSAGMVKFGGEIFSMRNPSNISAIIKQSGCVEEGETLSIVLTKDKNILSNNGVITSRLNIEVRSNRVDRDFILAETVYRKNILPKTEYNSFENLRDKKYNYIDITNRRYSLMGEATCNPVITHLFAKELIKKRHLTDFDRIILALGMNKVLIENSLLVEYFASHNLVYNFNKIVTLFDKILHTNKPIVPSPDTEETYIKKDDEYM